MPAVPSLESEDEASDVFDEDSVLTASHLAVIGNGVQQMKDQKLDAPTSSLLAGDKILLKLLELEEKCIQQDGEIMLLKSALSNAIKRLDALEDSNDATKNTPGYSPKKRPTSAVVNGGSSTKSDIRLATTTPPKTQNGGGNHQQARRTTSVGRTPSVSSMISSSPRTRLPSAKTSSRPPSASRASIRNRRSSSDDAIEGSEKDGQSRIILARKISSPKKRYSLGGEDQNQSKDGVVKFFIRGRALALYPPSEYEEAINAGGPPEKELHYGYRGRDCRDNLALLTSGDLVYNMAGVVVLYNQKTRAQRHYLEHTDSIKCVAIHPDQCLIASGQVYAHSGKAHVRVWNSRTLETLSDFGHTHFERAVCAVSFSSGDGKFLAAIDESNDHVLSLWDWENKWKITEMKCSQEIIFNLTWHPFSDLNFITYGKSHLGLWTFDLDTNRLSKKMAIFEKYAKAKYVLSATYTKDGNIVAGDSNGSIFLYKEGSNRVWKAAENVHEGGVFGLCVTREDLIVSGGRNGQMILWNCELKKLRDIGKVDERYGSPRCIIEDVIDDSFIVGTAKNCLVEIQGEYATSSLLMQGHSDEMWGLAVHPSQSLFLTCASDQLVCVWDSKEKKVKWAKSIESNGQCGAFHPDQDALLIGTIDGRMIVMETSSGDILTEFQLPKDALDIKVSPDGKQLAIGCHDNNIYIYPWPTCGMEFKKPKVMQGHSSFVAHLDWSTDSQFIQSNSGDYEILYWQAESGLQVVTPAALRDVEWATWTNTLGFPVMGIWPEGADGSDINACDRSPDQEYVATGDDFGAVKLFDYPCTKLKSECYRASGHSSHVTCVRFLRELSGLVSTGGKDCSVMQWKLIHSSES